MNCLICNNEKKYYFSKTYKNSHYKHLMSEIDIVKYYKCEYCGFVVSKTHQELTSEKWNKLNHDFHHYIENNKTTGNQPPYIEQALMLKLLSENKLIDIDEWIDYGAGYGTLSKLTDKYFNLNLPYYDKYIKSDDTQSEMAKINEQGYKTVISSAIFEHILSRKDLDNINKLVKSDGCLIVHTVVVEKGPKNDNWFYLEPPVHTAFHTNKSMSILMEQWGYKQSIYSPKSKCWVLFKENNSKIKKITNKINEELQTRWFYYKEGFMNYWI